jgi:hypothetical protein
MSIEQFINYLNQLLVKVGLINDDFSNKNLTTVNQIKTQFGLSIAQMD